MLGVSISGGSMDETLRDAERYRALRAHRLHFFPYLKWYPEEWKGKWALKIPQNNREADQAVDQLIEEQKEKAP